MCDKCKCSCTCEVQKPFPTVDWQKPIQTRSGDKARFIGTCKAIHRPHIVAVSNLAGTEESIYQVNDCGTGEGGYQIVNVPEKMVRPIRYSVISADSGKILQSDFHRHGLNIYRNTTKYIVLRTVSETAIPESLARKVFKEWIAA